MTQVHLNPQVAVSKLLEHHTSSAHLDEACSERSSKRPKVVHYARLLEQGAYARIYTDPEAEQQVIRVTSNSQHRDGTSMPHPVFLNEIVYSDFVCSSMVSQNGSQLLIHEHQMCSTLPRLVPITSGWAKRPDFDPYRLVSHLLARLARLHDVHRLCHMDIAEPNILYDPDTEQYLFCDRGNLHLYSDAQSPHYDPREFVRHAHLAPEFFPDEYEIVFPDHAYFVGNMHKVPRLAEIDEKSAPRQQRLRDLRKADIFALGITLIHILTDERLATLREEFGCSRCMGLRHVLPGLPRLLSRCGVPPVLQQVILACVDPDPFRRPFPVELVQLLESKECFVAPKLAGLDEEIRAIPFADELHLDRSQLRLGRSSFFYPHLASHQYPLTVQQGLMLRYLMELVVRQPCALHVFFTGALILLQTDWKTAETECLLDVDERWGTRVLVSFYLAHAYCEHANVEVREEHFELLEIGRETIFGDVADLIVTCAWHLRRQLRKPNAYMLLCDLSPDFAVMRVDCLKLLMEVSIILLLHPSRQMEHPVLLAEALLNIFRYLRTVEKPRLTTLAEEFQPRVQELLFALTSQKQVPFLYLPLYMPEPESRQ